MLRISRSKEYINSSCLSLYISFILENRKDDDRFFSFKEFLTIFKSHNMNNYKSAVGKLIKLSVFTEDDVIGNLDTLKDYVDMIRKSSETMKKSETMKLFTLLQSDNIIKNKIERSKEEKLKDTNRSQAKLIKECTPEEIKDNPYTFSKKKIFKSKDLVEWLVEHPDHLNSLLFPGRSYDYENLIDAIETLKSSNPDKEKEIVSLIDPIKALEKFIEQHVYINTDRYSPSVLIQFRQRTFDVAAESLFENVFLAEKNKDILDLNDAEKVEKLKIGINVLRSKLSNLPSYYSSERFIIKKEEHPNAFSKFPLNKLSNPTGLLDVIAIIGGGE